MHFKVITALAPINMAVIKYWGKKDEKLIIPVNDSVSVTLRKTELCAKTTVACSENFESDKIWLNGKEEDIQNPRLQNCITELKRKGKNKKFANFHIHICSENNFPTAAGLASSAAGFACLVKALSALYDVEDDLTKIARQGSGSACRSLHGGFVHWIAGSNEDGSDSFAQQIADKDHWPELKVLILVVNASKKEVSSTKGMQRTVMTSSLLPFRISDIVPNRVQAVSKAILEKDFHTFAEITMKESNQFHAVCLDSFPPIHYLNSTSHAIIRLVHGYNDFYGETKVAYTFDAGSNAVLYSLEKDVAEVLSLVETLFPPEDKKGFKRGLKYPAQTPSEALLESLQMTPSPDAVKYVISTGVGSGAKIIDDNQHLLDHNGFPLSS